MVPCSRSRMIAAPVRMIVSMVTWLMMPMTLVNQDVVMFGLKAMRTSRLTGVAAVPSARERKSASSPVDDLLDVAGADAGLHHRGGIDVDLDRGVASGQHVALEVGRDVQDEGERPESIRWSTSLAAIGRGGLK